MSSILIPPFHFSDGEGDNNERVLDLWTECTISWKITNRVSCLPCAWLSFVLSSASSYWAVDAVAVVPELLHSYQNPDYCPVLHLGLGWQAGMKHLCHHPIPAIHSNINHVSTDSLSLPASISRRKLSNTPWLEGFYFILLWQTVSVKLRHCRREALQLMLKQSLIFNWQIIQSLFLIEHIKPRFSFYNGWK